MKIKGVLVSSLFFIFLIYYFFGGISSQETLPPVDNTPIQNEPSSEIQEVNSLSLADESIEEQEQEIDGEEQEEIADISDEEIQEELGDGGFNSGFFHDIDIALDRWLQSDLDNREERIAEIRALIEEGKIDEAKELLGLYEEFAQHVEEEVTPEERDHAVKSSRIIRKAIKNIENKII